MMKGSLTTTRLVTYYTCPWLYYVEYVARQPLPALAMRRRFGIILHAAIAAYERHGRSLATAFAVLGQQAGLTTEDSALARAILEWRHGQVRPAGSRPVMVEGTLQVAVRSHRLVVRMDRLDGVGEDLELVEYKTGRRVDEELVQVQFAILAFAVHAAFGRAPSAWRLELLRARHVKTIEASRNPDALKERVAALADGIVGRQWAPRPYDGGFCARCPARECCPRVSARPKPLALPSAPQGAQLVLF